MQKLKKVENAHKTEKNIFNGHRLILNNPNHRC